MMLDWRRRRRPVAKLYVGLCSAAFRFKRFGQLLSDTGATRRRRGNPLSERFSYPGQAASAEFLASAPQYWARPRRAEAAAATLEGAE
jgi:hypothetical protein